MSCSMFCCCNAGSDCCNEHTRTIAANPVADEKCQFSYLHGGHLENVAYFQFFLMFIGIVDHESMETYTKIVFLTGLEPKILPKT